MRTVLVKPKSGPERAVLRSARAASLRERHLAQRFARLGIEQWSVPQGRDPKDFAAELMATGEFEYAEPNVRRYRRDSAPNDPGYASQWAMHGAAGSMNMEAAWELTTGSRDVIVAVIDDGMATDHPDLEANLWTNPGEIADDGIDNDGNDYIDDVHGWDFAGNDNDPRLSANLESHGTMVAGCVGAEGHNGQGVAGAAWQVSIMPLRIAFSGELYVSSTLDAFEYAISNGAHIINASWGGTYYSQTEANALTALEQAGILLVTAAGNWYGDNDLVVDYPSGLPNKNIVSVAASNQANGMVPWSHYGTTNVDLAAPGVDILTTLNGSSYEYVERSDTIYAYNSGTSFSSPYVAGIAALIKSKALADGGDADFQEIKARLLAGAEAMDDAKGKTATGGRVDASEALTVTPRPVPMISAIVVDDSDLVTGNGNGELDPGETVALKVTLENYWRDAQSLDAALSCDNPWVTVETDTDSLPGLAAGATAAEPLEFTVSLSDQAQAPARLLFDLEMSGSSTYGGWSATRTFPVRLSSLPLGTSIQARLNMASGQVFDVFHVDVPEGVEALSVAVAANEDVDLLVSMGRPPQFDLYAYYHQNPDWYWERASYRASNLDVSTYSVANPQAGTYYFAVLSPREPYHDDSPFLYGIGASEDGSLVVAPPSEETSGSSRSGGCALAPAARLGLEWLFLAVLAACLRLRARRRG